MRKRPFHVVIARKLAICPAKFGITGETGFLGREVLVELLDVLYQSKMPARAARKIARDNAPLVDMLRKDLPDSFVTTAAELAMVSLSRRRDRKKGKKTAGNK